MKTVKVLVTGSGPYLPEWWKENESKLDAYWVLSINTSILVTEKRCHYWYRSSDFHLFHNEPIFQEYENRFHPKPDPSLPPPEPIEDPTHAMDWPVKYYRGDTSGTMLFNVLQLLTNEDVWNDNIEEISLIGCDLVYKDNQVNHFYGPTGTNDPMRLGEIVLRANLRMFAQVFKKLNINAFNLSPAAETLLPFPRKTL